MRHSKNGNGRPIHTNVLRPSMNAHVELGREIEQRFIEVCHLFQRIRGENLIPPLELNADMLLWRTMCVRHKKGDHRNTDDEIKSTQKVAQWTLDVKCELCDQPAQILEWG